MKKIVFLAFVLALLSLAVVDGFVRPVTVSLPPVHNIDTDLRYATIQEAIDAPQTLVGRSTPPSTTDDYDGFIIINNGDAYTTSISVTLSLSSSGVSEMRFSNDNNSWTEWEAYDVSKAWTLTTNDGTKTVYVQFKDSAVSPTFSDTIILDTTPPTVSIISPSDGAEVRSSPIIIWNGADATSGIGRYEIRLDDGPWIRRCNTCPSYTFSGVGDGSHKVEVKAFDKAGNSVVASVHFTLNTSPVGGPGYTEEQAIIVVVILVVIVALAAAIYFLKIRKKIQHLP